MNNRGWKEFLSEVSNSWVISPKDETCLGEEYGQTPLDSGFEHQAIYRFINEDYTKLRYLFCEDKGFISGIVVEVTGEDAAKVEAVFTREDRRKQGFATRLFERVKRDFNEVASHWHPLMNYQVDEDNGESLGVEIKGKPNVVTVDFDNTLKFIDSGKATPVVKVIKDIKRLNPDVKIHIVTARKETEFSQNEIQKFVKENGLEIDELHFTNRRRKAPLLGELGSEIHFDDNSDEWGAIERSDHPIEIIKIDGKTGLSLKDETIKRVSGKYVVYPKKGGKRLGTHKTKKKALKQLAAIEIQKKKKT